MFCENESIRQWAVIALTNYAKHVYTPVAVKGLKRITEKKLF